jgi:hypothetical protein
MDLSRRALAAPLLTLLAAASLLSGCTSEKGDATLRPSPGVQLKLGAPMFEFQPADVAELTLHQNDPVRDRRWQARFARRSDGDWEIATAPEGRALIDRRANSAFLNHLLSTLTTLVWQTEPPQGDLENFGLRVPHYALRFRARDREFDLQLGLPAGAQDRYARVAGHDPALVVRGATLRMIELIESFETLRLATVLTFDRDRPDEIELFEREQSVLYAQRHNDDWADRRLRPVRHDVMAYLDYLVHLRMRRYIDDPAQARAITARLTKSAAWRIVLTDRRGVRTELRAGRGPDGALVAISSDRPETAFELFPETARGLKPARRKF